MNISNCLSLHWTLVGSLVLSVEGQPLLNQIWDLVLRRSYKDKLFKVRKIWKKMLTMGLQWVFIALGLKRCDIGCLWLLWIMNLSNCLSLHWTLVGSLVLSVEAVHFSSRSWLHSGCLNCHQDARRGWRSKVLKKNTSPTGSMSRKNPSVSVLGPLNSILDWNCACFAWIEDVPCFQIIWWSESAASRRVLKWKQLLPPRMPHLAQIKPMNVEIPILGGSYNGGSIEFLWTSPSFIWGLLRIAASKQKGQQQRYLPSNK